MTKSSLLTICHSHIAFGWSWGLADTTSLGFWLWRQRWSTFGFFAKDAWCTSLVEEIKTSNVIPEFSEAAVRATRRCLKTAPLQLIHFWCILTMRSYSQICMRSKRASISSLSQIESFSELSVLMGYHQLPSWRNYWSIDPDLHVGTVTEIMPRNRFLHVHSEEAGITVYAQVSWKIWPNLEGFLYSCSIVHVPQ